MSLYVNTNISSLKSQRQLGLSNNAVTKSYERLSSGSKINSAKDDAPGLQITNRMTTQINGLNQGNRTAQDGISFAQTAEGAMEEISNMLQRIRTLSLQSANGTNNSDDRVAIQEEVSQLCAEIDRVAQSTTFGGKNLLNGETNYQVREGEIKFEADLSAARDKHTKFQVNNETSQIIDINLSLTSSKNYQYTEVNSTDAKEKEGKLTLGFDMVSLFIASGLDAQKDGKNVIIDSNNKDARTTGFIATSGNSISFDVTTAEGSQKVLENIDNFISCIDSKRAELGAIQNRLETTINNQSNISENVSESRSRIKDTDFAQETATLATQNILLQASQSILSQSNQRPQVALSLLQG